MSQFDINAGMLVANASEIERSTFIRKTYLT